MVYSDNDIVIGEHSHIHEAGTRVNREKEDVAKNRECWRKLGIGDSFEFFFGKESSFSFPFFPVHAVGWVSSYPLV